MITVDVLKGTLQFWWVVVIGAVLTMVACSAVGARPGVYWGQVDVVVLAPSTPSVPNAFQATQTRAIVMAGVLQREVAGPPGANVVSDEVTIVGQGVRDGSWVRLPNAGGQWANNFDRPVLDVQASAPTRQGVQRRLASALRDVQGALDDLQARAGVAVGSRFTATTSPQVPVVRYDEGRPLLAMATTALLGFGMTVAMVILRAARAIRLPRPRNRLPSAPEPLLPALGQPQEVAAL